MLFLDRIIVDRGIRCCSVSMYVVCVCCEDLYRFTRFAGIPAVGVTAQWQQQQHTLQLLRPYASC